MAGFFSNFLPFGSSNQSNPSNAPVAPPAVPGTYQPAVAQLQQQNNNSLPNPPGSTGVVDPTAKTEPAAGSSMDQFNDLFTMAADGSAAPTNPMLEPLLSYDPAKLREAAQKANFAAGIDPELATKALQGDSAAFLQVINAAAQNAFMAATASTAQVVEQAVRKNNDRFDQVLPDRVRNVQLSQTQTKNPALSHQAALPLVSAMKTQIAAKNPGLSPARVTEIAESYFITLANDLASGNPSQQQSRGKANEPDYSIFM